MRRLAAPCLFALALCGIAAAVSPSQSLAQGRPSQGGSRTSAPARVSGPPHAWLFGTWTGGLFPVLEGMAAQDCRTQPTVAFAQDVVGHTSLTGATMTRRVIETVRTSPTGAEFRFSPDEDDSSSFGCEDPNLLHVARENNDMISFPHCAAFPYPLVRCSAPTR